MVHGLFPSLAAFILVVSVALSGCASLYSSGGSGMDDGNGPSSSLAALRRGVSVSDGPLQSVYFDFDRYDLRADARESLRANAEWLKSNPSVRLDIEGHCDERGTIEYNLALGARRASAARDYLVTLGVSPDRISTISFGEETPVCRDASEPCWQVNRNARFAIATGPVS